ncbi:hypothetical protein BN1232_06077 [Mycobacterium lentiflavum]|uniref:Uncharacterized protein n=1 Tax=Mycobacterium lentiflavum TaxID=141349 RepID=A0A0E4CRE0_MYCLN|nr:hypothetical protein [Mycobacterium lentiflavum]CQD24154.1 hypothetical protein BN1232_06077 [Mycobacterium lentiflavum]
MSVEAAEQVLGALQRVESLFAAPDGAPVLRVAPQPRSQHAAPAARALGRGEVERPRPPGTTQGAYDDTSGE